MKILLLVFILCSSIFSQVVQHSLDGVESENGTSILVLRVGNKFYPNNPIYGINAETGEVSFLMNAFDTGGISRGINDFKFFSNNPNNFLNCGETIFPDNHGLISLNDTLFISMMFPVYFIDISRQNPDLAFAGDGYLWRSFDGGITWPLDSLRQFSFCSVYPFNDNILFGLTYDNNLIKSYDVGLTSFLVDTSHIFWDNYFQILYDVNQFHIYRVNRILGAYSLNVSNNKGNAFTWTKTFQSENPIYISIDSTQSGVIYLADGRRIYKSVNNGYTFSEYKSLPSKLIGIYKKPNSEIIYVASKRSIFKITPDSTTIIKSLPTPDEEFSWFPLAVGNLWAYNQYWFDEGWPGPPTYTFAGTKYMEVTKDTLIESKKYFVVENDYISFEVFPPKMFLRIDSLTGFIYRYWEELSGEYIFHNINAEVGDTILYPPFPDNPFYILESEQPIIYLGIDTHERRYWEYLPCSCYHTLIKGFGLARTYFNEFGGSENILKGCVINGVLYGDTTFVVDVEDEQNPIPKEYKLEQNYPNPFNPSTKISWQSPIGSWQTLKVFDVLGNEVATLVNEYRDAGSYDVDFPSVETLRATSLPSGVYFYQLKINEFVQTNKMLLLK